MEFAALTEEADAEVEPSSHAPLEEYPRQRNLPSARIVIPVSLVLFVLLIGGIVYATARHSARLAPGEGAAVSVAPGSMPPIDKRNNQDGGFDIFSMQQPGGADSILGIGSTIQSIIYWTTVLSIVFVISSIGMLVWVARDSRNRGMESVASWITPILLTSIVAFLVYLLARPQGKLVRCRHCNNRCLENAATCPHCRRPKPVRKTRRKFED
jgi:hypothetical protein